MYLLRNLGSEFDPQLKIIEKKNPGISLYHHYEIGLYSSKMINSFENFFFDNKFEDGDPTDNLRDFNNHDVSEWYTSNVTNMKNMFRKCRRFNVDISSWDVSNVRTIENMFQDCTSFNRDLSIWRNYSSNGNDDEITMPNLIHFSNYYGNTPRWRQDFKPKLRYYHYIPPNEIIEI